jgi:hypothetical protein
MKRTLDEMETFRVYKGLGTVLHRIIVHMILESSGEKRKEELQTSFLESFISFWNVEFYY